MSGAAYTDIRQGSVGDCYFMATLAEVALKNPSLINSMFTINGDGTYGVRFFNGTQTAFVTVDSYLPTDANGRFLYAGYYGPASATGNELWTMLAEKAYVQLNEMGWERAGMTGSGQNSYAAINGGYMYMALAQVTGQATKPFSMTSVAANFTDFVNAWNGGR